MAFILGKDISDEVDDDLELRHARFAAYREYLESIREKLPASTYQFAIADWHYDPQSHECPHDAWVESLVISELFSGDRREKRRLEITVKLLGAYHDGYIDIVYQGVESYLLETPAGFEAPPLNVGHGDWLRDEIRYSERGFVVHEIEFSRGTNWLIECTDIIYRWTPFTS
ncbi:MAG TPA: hypothetical protein VLB68_26765 [Pyrinomonadaceae bacterium]|nr:hypothetical protein [Pyrinomonadaceae bacterium]